MTTDPPAPSFDPVCHTCRSLAGKARIRPGPPIYEGRYWVVEHAYPCAMRGWLVIVLRRHAEALHDLTADEWAEWGDLQRRAVRALVAETGCAKEYLALFAEKPGFRHLHQHVVAVPADLPADLRGTKIFARINPAPADVVPPADLAAFCARLASAFAVV